MQRISASNKLRIGSWPGPSSKIEFIDILCDGLQAAGAQIVDVKDVRSISAADIDILQIHWPEHPTFLCRGRARKAFRAADTLRAIARLKAAGVKISWLVHNLKPHDVDRSTTMIWRAYSAGLAKLTDGFLTLSEATLPLAEAQFSFSRRAKRTTINHPHYPDDSAGVSRESARIAWAMDEAALNLAFIGRIRPYKGILQLAELVRNVPPERMTLTIAGDSFDDRLPPQLSEIAETSRSVRYHPHHLEREPFASLVTAADYVVLPFESSLHSGSLIHALSMNRPVLTTATPFAADVQRLVGPEWVALFEPPLALENLLTLPPPPSGRPCLDAFDPTTQSRHLMQFYASL